MNRRVRVFHMPLKALEDCIKGSKRLHNIPGDAQLLAICPVPTEKGCIGTMWASDSFEPVPMGQLVPASAAWMEKIG